MPDPQTANMLLSVPARGSNVGTWDVPNNGDFVAIDGLFGGVASVGLSSTPVTLTSPSGTPAPGAGPTQAQNSVIRFSGVLTAGVTVTLPLPGPVIIENRTTGNFVVTLRAVASGEVIGIPQGSARRIYNDGTNVRFTDLPDVGSYWDYAGATVPAWVAACTIPPWLNCDGTTFSAVTYPYLNGILGTTTLPDSKGRARFALNQSSGRLTTAGGIDGDTRFAAGGDGDGLIVAQANLPVATLATNITDPGHTHNVKFSLNTVSAGPGGGLVTNISSGGSDTGSSAAASNTTGITASTPLGGSATPLASVSPGYVGGITLIRAG